jgi:hypothetical protein
VNTRKDAFRVHLAIVGLGVGNSCLFEIARKRGLAMNRNDLSNATVSSGKRWLAVAAALGTLIGADLSSPARAANLLANGDFENGEYASTLGGYTNSYVPIG